MSTTPFGPQLIGMTEKTLGALLHRILHGTDLTEPQWVVLRLADLLDGSVDGDGLIAAASARAHFTDAAALVGALTGRGLLDAGRLTTTGRHLVVDVQSAIAAETAPIWDDLNADDIAAATRVLNEVVARARVVLG